MIIIVNGPLGIGKSETSWQLLYQLEQAAMLDGDFLAAINPFDYYNPEHLDYAYSIFHLLVGYHLANGIRRFVINWVFETPAGLARLKSLLAEYRLPVYVYRLVCDLDIMIERIHRRNRAEIEWERQRARELVTILDRAAQEGDLGQVLDTTRLTAEQAAAAILADMGRQAG